MSKAPLFAPELISPVVNLNLAVNTPVLKPVSCKVSTSLPCEVVLFTTEAVTRALSMRSVSRLRSGSVSVMRAVLQQVKAGFVSVKTWGFGHAWHVIW